MKNDNKQNKELIQTDVKCRFFAQYWSTEYTYENKWGKFKGTLNDKNNIINFYSHIENAFLVLKQLTEISNEEAIECAKMFNWLQITDNPELWNHPVTKEKVIKMNDNCKYGICILSVEKLNIEQIDFLRSKGYALPFMEYSVSDLISFGWIRLF